MKLMLTVVAAALLGPMAPVFAEDPAAADAKRAGDEATVAGQSAEASGENAKEAADRADHSANSKEVSWAKHDPRGVKQAIEARRALEKADPGLYRTFGEAPGYVVFATVGKGGAGIGGAYGTGILFEEGMALGKATLTQLTVGLQLGGQAYTEAIVFETRKSLDAFKKGEFTLAAELSAVAVKSGVSTNAKYVAGVGVFTLAKGGAMAEASVGGQRLSYLPFERAIANR